MALVTKKLIFPAAEERRRFQRVKVHLLGRYMLPDRREFPCQVINMSPGGLALLAPGIGNVGDRVIAYLDHIGRVEGKITRIIDNGFSMTIGATARKRDKLAAQLTWLANRDILNLPEDRRHDRIVPRNPIATDHVRGWNQDDLPHHRPVDVGRGDRSRASGHRCSPSSCSERCSPGWCEISRTASPSSSSTSNWPTLSKRALARGKAQQPPCPQVLARRSRSPGSQQPQSGSCCDARTP